MAIKLKDLLEGLSAEEITKVENQVAENAKKKNAQVFIDAEGQKYVPAFRLTEVVKERDELKSTLSESSKTIEKLTNQTKDNAEAQTTIAELQKELENSRKISTTAAIVGKIGSIKLDNLELVAPPEDYLAMLNKEAITIGADNQVYGVEEQLKQLAETKSYMFKETKPAGTGLPGSPKGAASFPGNSAPKPGDFGAMLAETNAAPAQQSTYFN